MNRLEDCSASAADHHRHHRIAADIAAMDDLLVALFVESFDQPPDRIVLDVDATDMPLHGRQEGRFFHGYYDEYCHLPLYIFCGERLLCAKLRTSNRDAGDGLVEELERIVPQLRAAWPETRIVVRGDSGFCRERIMAWCEGNGVHHLFGLARNKRLLAEIAPQMENRIKEQKLMMFADRVSTRKMHSNQIRLHLSSIAYVLMQSLRRLALAGTALARAQCGTIRVRLLKLATRVSTSVRRVRLQFSDSHPGQALFRQVAGNIARIPKRA